MENWVIIGLFVGFYVLNTGLTSILWYFFNKKFIQIQSRLLILEGEAEAEAQKEHERLVIQSQKGVEARADNRAMRSAALQEGRALIAQLGPDILSKPEALNAAKQALAQLATKYPMVAEEVADRLISEFHAEPYKDLIKGVIANALKGTIEAPSASIGPALYG